MLNPVSVQHNTTVKTAGDLNKTGKKGKEGFEVSWQPQVPISQVLVPCVSNQQTMETEK